MSNTLEEKTILNFINLVFDMQRLLQDEYKSYWRKPPYNFFVKKYMIIKEKNHILFQWVNMNDELHYLIFRKPKYKSRLKTKLYYVFHRVIETDDKLRAENIVTRVIFPDFCNELQISADFSEVSSIREAADLVLCNLYGNYFSELSIDSFFDMFKLRKTLSPISIEYITKYIDKKDRWAIDKV